MIVVVVMVVMVVMVVVAVCVDVVVDVVDHVFVPQRIGWFVFGLVCGLAGWFVVVVCVVFCFGLR